MNRGYLIAGGGAAALSAARAIRQRDRENRVRMLCGEGVLPYSRPFLTQTLKTGAAASSLVPAAWYEKNGVEVIYDTAKELNAGDKTLTLGSGETLLYEKLLWAAGANAFNPVKTGESGGRVFVLRTGKDAQELVSRCASSKAAVVAGGGILGVEAALALAFRGLQVTVCELGERLMGVNADEQLSEQLKGYLEKKGIDTLTGTGVVNSEAGGALLSDGRRLEADFVLVSAGICPEIGAMHNAGVKVKRGVDVNGNMETSVRDIFAAGDCAEFNGRVAGLAASAAEQGSVAGAAMTGDFTAVYAEKLPATYFNNGDLKFISVGDVGIKSGELLTPREGIRLYSRDGVITGAVLVGEVKQKLVAFVRSGPAESEALGFLKSL